MAITLSTKTQDLIESGMKEMGFDDRDTFIRLSVHRLLYPIVEVDLDELNSETREAIERAEKQESTPWEQVRDRIFSRIRKR